MIEKTPGLNFVITLWLAIRQCLPFGESDGAPKVKQAIVNYPAEHSHKTQMKKNHAEGDYCQLPVPDSAKKTAGNINNKQHQKSVEPEGIEYQRFSTGFTENSDTDNAAYKNSY